MRGMNTLPLDDDIVDRIFIFLPDFRTLTALRLTSKAFNDVYITHPNSIIRAICYNITGPALPQAIRLARCQTTTPPTDADENISSLSSSNSPVTPDEINKLMLDARAVQYLERLFSMMFKDRTSSSSELTSMESWRFRRAMYRMMLYSSIFPEEDILERSAEAYDEPLDPKEIQEERNKRKKLLSTMNTFDLYELYSISEFMIAVVQWLNTGGMDEEDEQQIYDLVLARGPYSLYEACRENYIDIDCFREIIAEHGFDETKPNLLEGYLSLILQWVWQERKAKPPAEDDSHWLSILEALPSAKDTCRLCSKECGHLSLWSEGSWRMLCGTGSTSIQSLRRLVPGQLMTNVIDAPVFQGAFNALESIQDNADDWDMYLTKLLREIHEIRTVPYEDWKKEDLLCEECILGILKSHLHLWLLEKKREKSGSIQQENCWELEPERISGMDGTAAPNHTKQNMQNVSTISAHLPNDTQPSSTE